MLTPKQAKRVLDAIPASKRALKEYDMSLSTLVQQTQDESLEKAVTDHGTGLAGKSSDEQARATQAWCEENLGKGLVTDVRVLPEDVRLTLDLNELRRLAPPQRASAPGRRG